MAAELNEKQMEALYAPYENQTDEEILMDIRDNNDKRAVDYLIYKYRSFVRAKARSYFLVGADREDIFQEGMIGFYKAIRDFRTDKLASFRAFAELCVTRQIITAVKTATRQKHIPLNTYISLNKPIYDEESDRTLLDILSGVKVMDPEELVVGREELDVIEKKMEHILSTLEWKVLMSYRSDMSAPAILNVINLAKKFYPQGVSVLPTTAGTGPMHTVFDALEVPMVAFGLGNANSRDHGGDENVRIADYYTHIELVEELIRSYE